MVSELQIKAAKYYFHTRLTKLGKTESQNGEGCRESATLLQDEGKARAYRLFLHLFVIQRHHACSRGPFEKIKQNLQEIFKNHILGFIIN